MIEWGVASIHSFADVRGNTRSSRLSEGGIGRWDLESSRSYQRRATSRTRELARRTGMKVACPYESDNPHPRPVDHDLL